MSRANLNRRVILEAPVHAADGAGGFTESWQVLGTLWVQIKPQTGRETNGDAGAVSIRRFRITTRGAPDGHSNRPKPGQRMRMGTRLLKIEAVSEHEPDARFLLCDAIEEVAT